MSQRFGNGIALSTEDDAYAWDIRVDGSGDIDAVRGVSELEKDISFRVARALWNGIGFQPTPKYLKAVEVATRNAILRDPRIDRIVSIDTEFKDHGEEVEVYVQCVASDEEFDFVIEV